MGLTKQAKVLSKVQQDTVLKFLETTKHPVRNKVIFLLSLRAGLRAKEIAALTIGMVTDAQGQISDAIRIENSATKGGNGGGVIWMNKELQSALVEYCRIPRHPKAGQTVVFSSAGKAFSPASIVNMFAYWYKELGFDGCSSHSGRRTFITNGAKKISTVGGSLKDIQMLARHSSLQMTQRYIDSEIEAQKKIVQLI